MITPANDLKQTSSGKLSIIEMIRGLAALAVCCYHFREMGIVKTSNFLTNSFSDGYTGVQAFFVVSGFIIPYSLLKAKYKITDFYHFFLKRCTRIEIPYIVSIIIVIFSAYVSTLAPHYAGTPFFINWKQVLLHLGYLPTHFGYEWLQSPYWTLEAEFYYYIIIGLLLPILWKNEWLFIIGMCCALLSSFTSQFSVFVHMPFFVFGISTCAYKLKHIGKITYASLLSASFIICFLKEFPMVMAYVALGTSLLICYGQFESKITSFLGKISFSLYLMHVPVGFKILNLLGKYAHKPWQVWIAYIIALSSCIYAAYLFNRFIETPSLLMSKKILYTRQKNSSPIPQLVSL